MLYYVIRRSPHKNINPLNKLTINNCAELLLNVMPRYHYSRTAPNSASSSAESFFSRHPLNDQTSKHLTTTTSDNKTHKNINQYTYGSFKSTFIPLVTSSRAMTPNKREFIQIPITREDKVSTANNSVRSVPITFISETSSLISTSNNNNNNNNNAATVNSKGQHTSILRPSSKYKQNYSNNNNNNEESATTVPRLPSVSRRLSLTVPIMMTTTTTTIPDDDETVKQNVSSTATRHFQPMNIASIPTNSARISSAVLRSSPLSTSSNNQLQRQRTDLTDLSSSEGIGTFSHLSPTRRAEIMAREAIQGIVRFHQQRNGSTPDNNLSIRSPSLSRRVIINLKNNQSVSLDSRLSSANSSSLKPSIGSSSFRTTQRTNLYHVPILQDNTTTRGENSLQSTQSSSIVNNNENNYKNEFHMEIPIALTPNIDQENQIQNNNLKDEIIDYDRQTTIVAECLPSSTTNSNQTLKSILKRSTSRETFGRKNVSFMNA